VNLPNQITLARLFLAVVLFIILGQWCAGTVGTSWYFAFSLFIVTILSDGLDGYIARARGQITAFGRIADPLADKVVICGVLVMAGTIEQTRALVPSWIIILVLAREFLVSGLRGYLEGQGLAFGARWEGKTKLVVQSIYCGAVLFYPGSSYGWVWWTAVISLWATAAITVYSAVSYVRKAREIIVASPDI